VIITLDFTCWTTDDEMYLGALDVYQNEHFLTILDLVMLKVTGIKTLLPFVAL
jgi:hypothetical protein